MKLFVVSLWMRPLLILALFLLGCKSIISKKYQFNRKFPFYAKSEYIDYLKSAYGFPGENILSIDSVGYYEYASSKLTIYVGTFINDSVQYEKSVFLKDNQTCMGRIESELKAIRFNERSRYDSSVHLHDLHLNFIKDGRKANNLFKNKPIVLLNYSYALGTYYDKLYKEFGETCRNYKDFELYVISMDWLHHLPY